MNIFLNVLTIGKKELKSYFDSATAYIVLVVFLLLWQFLFFKSIFLVGEASLRILFDLLPWLFLFVIPALTMGSVSQERTEGTLEVLLTHPLKEWEFLLGKFLGSFIFVIIALLFIIPIGISLSLYGDLDGGVILGQFLASICMAMVLISLGVFVSSLFKSQITALLISVVVSFFFIVFQLGFITGSLPVAVGSLLERLSISSHFTSMARGVIDLRDIWYFLSMTAVFLSLAYLQLIKRKSGNKKEIYRSWKIGVALFIGIAVLLNVLGSRIPGRIDLTEENLYTLSPATKNLVGGLQDVVNVTLYASAELPAQFKPLLRDTEDILRDYETLAKGNIVFSEKDPSDNASLKSEATSLGVQEVQFNVVSGEEFQVKKGYFGLTVAHGGKTEAIPFIENTGDLEYLLTSFIAKLTTTEKKKVIFLSGHGEKSITQGYSTFVNELKGQFDVQDFSFPASSSEGKVTPVKTLPENTSVLVIAGPTQEIPSDEREGIRSYIKNGGAALFVVDPVSVDLKTFSASENANSFADFLSEYGIQVAKNIVYDLKSNQNVQFGGGFVTIFLPYPFWINALPADTMSPIMVKIKQMVFPWASSLSIDTDAMAKKNLVATKLVTTTNGAGEQNGSFTLDPQQRFSNSDLSEKLIAVSVTNAGENEKQSRIIAVTDSDFLTNDMVQRTAENFAFGMNSVSWLAQEESLAGIRLKSRAMNPLTFENETQKALVKFGNMGIAILFPLFFGVYRLMRRRSLRKFSFHSYFKV
ncbi:Gldg family protein [Candidatus Peregrinibacteria bacterium]|nr:Gldg family protein [Candidatus Peregrinibacteria bacterium]